MTQALQRTPVALLLQQGLDLGLEDLRVEGFEQVVHRATGITLEHSRLGLLIGGQENDRGKPCTLAAAHQAGDFEAIHARHLHIQQHQVDFVLKQRAQGFRSGACGEHLPVLTGQQGTHADQILRVIVDDQ
ncbi:hypothetical protein D3C80_1722770 [compost metagenome]